MKLEYSYGFQNYSSWKTNIFSPLKFLIVCLVYLNVSPPYFEHWKYYPVLQSHYYHMMNWIPDHSLVPYTPFYEHH